MLRNSFKRRLGYSVTRSLSLFTILLVTFSTSGLGQLLITDCQGFTRALHQVDPGSLNKIEINVTDALGNPQSGVEVSLSNSVTGETVTAISNNGVAVFQNVAPGAFSVSTTASGVTVGAVSVGSMGVGIVASSAAVVTTGVIGGGAVIGVETTIESITESPEEDTSATPVPTPDEVPDEEPGEEEPIPTPIDCNCDPDATPKPLSPFD